MTGSAAPILVTGATGRHGATGLTVVRRLRERGLAVRALTRHADARVSPLIALGAEVVTADLFDRRSLLTALDGVETAYFTYPVAAGIVDAAASFASAGRVTGLQRVVVMSMGAARPDSPSALGRAQWLAEEVLDWAGFSCLFLRVAALFFENIALLHRADIEGDGVIRNSFGDVAVSWISGEDAGKLAAAALLHPERFEGKAVYASGGAALTHTQIAGRIGAHIGGKLHHETISASAWEARLIELGAGDERINPAMAAHIAAIGAALRQSPPVNDLFRRLTQDVPQSLDDVLAAGLLRSAST